MIANSEMLTLKQRMLVAADAAYRIAASPDQFVIHDQEQFELVMAAMLALKSDLRRLLAEHDILRGMFGERLTSFFMDEVANAKEGTGDRGDLGTVPDQAASGGGEDARPEREGADLGVPPRRVSRKRAGGSKPRGHRKGNGKSAIGVDAGGGESQMDRSQDG